MQSDEYVGFIIFDEITLCDVKSTNSPVLF